MPNTTLHYDQDAGGWRYDTIHRMTRRCHAWDYHGLGRYMITLTLADRRRGFLGELVPSSLLDGPSSKLEGTVALTPLGEIVAQCWRELANWPGVELGDFQVMPEHFHGIIKITARQKHALGQIIGSFKARSTTAARAWAAEVPAGVPVPASLLAGPSSKLEGIGRAGPSSKLEGTGGAGPSSKLEGTGGAGPSSKLEGTGTLWSKGLCDSILWNDGRYARAVRYVANNPMRLAIKRQFPEFFQVSRALEVAGLGWFSAVGNHFLLEAPVFAQIQCSRSDFEYARDSRGKLLKDAPPRVETAAFREKWQLASKLASTGAVLVSPCVSEGEREIARRAVACGAKTIVLQNKGFPKGFKPSGKAFEQCAEGRLLLLAPIAWPWVPGKKPMTRVDACILNRLAQLIAKDGAAEITYRGAVPEEVGAQCQRACSLATPPT